MKSIFVEINIDMPGVVMAFSDIAFRVGVIDWIVGVELFGVNDEIPDDGMTVDVAGIKGLGVGTSETLTKSSCV